MPEGKFASLQSMKKESDPELDPDPDPLARVTDPHQNVTDPQYCNFYYTKLYQQVKLKICLNKKNSM